MQGVRNRPNNCRVRAIKALFDRNLYGFLPSTITHLVLRLAAQWRNRRAYRNSGVETDGLPRFGRERAAKGRRSQQWNGSKLRRAQNAARGLVRVAAEPFRPASEPLALLYRILGPGTRPSRHSRGTGSGMHRACHTRGHRRAKRRGGRVVHIFIR